MKLNILIKINKSTVIFLKKSAECKYSNEFICSLLLLFFINNISVLFHNDILVKKKKKVEEKVPICPLIPVYKRCRSCSIQTFLSLLLKTCFMSNP